MVSEALAEGFEKHAVALRAEEVLAPYQIAFAPLSKEEMLILDGIFLEPITIRAR